MDSAKIRAQVIIELAAALILLIVFLFATTKIFVWFGNNIVQRHKKFEETRTAAGTGATTAGQVDFYDQSERPLDIFGED